MDFAAPIMELQRSIRSYINDRIELSPNIQLLPINGWYCGFDFLDGLGVRSLGNLSEMDISIFEKKVVIHFNDEIEGIENKLRMIFPGKSDIM